MIMLIALALDDIYPFPVPHGARANFVSDAGNLLQIGMPGITHAELRALKKGKAKCGIFVYGPVIVWIFDFKEGGQFDAPFSAQLYSREQLKLLDIENHNQRLAIEMHLIELNDQRLKAIRYFTIPHELTVKFLSAVQDQLSQPFDEITYKKKINEVYQFNIDQLISKTKLYKIGE
jgi:hypothetical protein